MAGYRYGFTNKVVKVPQWYAVQGRPDKDRDCITQL